MQNLNKDNVEARRIWWPTLTMAFRAGSPRTAAALAQVGSLVLVSYLFFPFLPSSVWFFFLVQLILYHTVYKFSLLLFSDLDCSYSY